MTTATNTDTDTEVNSDEVPPCDVHWREADGGLIFRCGAPATHMVRTHCGANLRYIEHEDRTDPMCERCLNEAMLITCELHDNTPVVISYSSL